MVKSTRTLFEKSYFWRLLAAFWETWKAIKEEEIVRRKHNNPTHAYRGCEKEKRRHVSRGYASEEKARISRRCESDNSACKSRQHEEEDKIKIFLRVKVRVWLRFDHLIWTSSCEWEWEWEWDSSGVDGWFELLYGVLLLRNSCKDSSIWFILESPLLFNSWLLSCYNSARVWKYSAWHNLWLCTPLWDNFVT